MLSALLVCAAALLPLHAAEPDAPYLQDVSFRATYQGAAPIAQWEQLPFAAPATAPAAGTGLLHLPSQDCFVALTAGGALFSSVRSLNQSLDDKIALSSPYSAWRSLGAADASASRLIPSSTEGFSFFVATSNNVVALAVDESCSSVLFSQVLLEDGADFGVILAAASSPSLLWLSSSGRGLQQLAIASGALAAVDVGGDTVSTLCWVQAWGKLFAGCDTTLRTLVYSGDAVQRVTHEWIGAYIDTVPLDMSYDSVNDALWLAENNSVHKLTAAGAWWRYGQRQGAPFGQITSVAAVGGYVWVGSALGMARVRGDVSARPSYDLGGKQGAAHAKSSDPWDWMFYGGNRYLVDTPVLAVVGGSAAGGGSSVLVASASGLARVDASLWTLGEKARAMAKFQERHDRHGLTTGIHLTSYGDVRGYQQECDDNDGLWTSMHAMGEAYRFMSTGEEDARDLAWKAFEALEMLAILPGAYPSFPARSFTLASESSWPGCDGDPWVDSPVDSAYRWKSTTSSDEIDGHLAVFPLILDHIARTAEEKSRVYALIEGITGGILANDLYLIDPSTGVPTAWGFWNPEEVNGNPEHYSERGTNSVGILAYTASAYSITHDEKYKKTFWDLAVNHDYLSNALNGKIDSPTEDNHSDNELFFQAYHIATYALQRLKGQEGSALYAEVEEMVSALLPSMQRTFALIGGEKSPLWLGIYAGTGGQEVCPTAVSSAVWTLRHWAVDLIEWPISNDERWDLTASPFFSRDSTDPIMIQIRPPSERAARKWNTDPFSLQDQDSGMSEEYPANWRFPYFLMRYNKLIV
jgi:hypothetical protein